MIETKTQQNLTKLRQHYLNCNQSTCFKCNDIKNVFTELNNLAANIV